jgi:hypothetical protein
MKMGSKIFNSFAIVLSLLSVTTFAATTKSKRTSVEVVDKGTGGFDMTIKGGAGSQAEKLYDSLSLIKEESEGAHNGVSKQVTGVFCEYLSPGTKRNATYTCIISLSYAGVLIPLEP